MHCYNGVKPFDVQENTSQLLLEAGTCRIPVVVPTSSKLAADKGRHVPDLLSSRYEYTYNALVVIAGGRHVLNTSSNYGGHAAGGRYVLNTSSKASAMETDRRSHGLCGGGPAV